MSEKKQKRYRALVGLNFADDGGEGRVEAGELIPVRFVDQIPDVWVGRKVEVV